MFPTPLEDLIMVATYRIFWNFRSIDIFDIFRSYADIIGSLVELASKYPASYISMNPYEYVFGTYQNSIVKVRRLTIPYKTLYAGHSLMFGS